jgi:hypothetical protein
VSAECRRWEAIGDRAAIGEPITEEDERFRSEHPAGCEACEREAAMWTALEGAAQEPDREAQPSTATVEAIVKQARVRDEGPPALPMRRAWGTGGRASRLGVGLAVVSALAAAASVVFVLRTRPWDGLSTSAPPDIAAVTRATVREVTGDVFVNGRRAVVGEPVLAGAMVRAEGRVCLDVEPAVRVCLDAASEARLADASLVHRIIELRRGHLDATLGHPPSGTSLQIDTPRGTVTAVGTAFSVDVANGGGPVVVRVREGVVVVRAPHAPDLEVAAGEEAVVGAPRASTVSPAAPLEPPAASSAAPSPAPSAVNIPQPSRGPSPRPPVTSAERGNLPAASADAAALLAEARTLRASGEFREAAEAYRRLESAYPESAEAHASLVSLGDLLVAQLADPAGGLKAFDAYLASGGVLAEEAAFGRIGALRALGREGEEREAVVSFLARYPGTLHDDALRARLRALGGSR